MDINTVCICGAGTMGSGIAQVFAMAGFYTILYEVNNEVLQKAKTAIDSGLQILVEKNKLTLQKKQETLSQILFTNDMQLCIADVFIEAIVEKAEDKIALFNQLAELNHSETILASNTSSLSISSIAEKVNNPQRVAGLHFFNPAPVMKLVEVVKGKQTDKEVMNRLIRLTKELGKTPVVCKDSPGFIVNRVARPFYIESLRLAEEGISNFEVIDRLLESRSFKLGPFKLMDLIGNDINYTVSCSVYEQLGQPERLRPSYIQKGKLDKGELGRKTKKGYYEY
ncbi:MAG: 3-hydroxyacyl-CoA dehydrogenase NAD-binding domain-containing protein [Bacteroidota bacterium]|nr:3-hydroxyacyl-CoA dehydrogenase NAD-binding domain-containing protein [Bacteroidota bacterium]